MMVKEFWFSSCVVEQLAAQAAVHHVEAMNLTWCSEQCPAREAGQKSQPG